MMKQIDVICPVFQEEEVIDLFHGRLSAVLNDLSKRYVFHIRYVLDPSPDQTEARLRMICRHDPRVSILVMSRRFGHEAALVAGIDCSSADAVIMLDSDLQHPPEIIPEMLLRWENGVDIVQAVREETRQTPAAKRITSRYFYLLFSKLGGGELPPGAADFRLLSREVVALFRCGIREHNPFLRGLVSWVGFRVDYFPFVPGTREHGRSKYGTFTLIRLALNGICSFSKVPLEFCIGAGLIIAALSIVGGSLQVVIYLVGTRIVPGWASLFTVVSFLSGIQLFFLGVVGEYISLIFDEVKGRPRYIIAQRYEGNLSSTSTADELHPNLEIAVPLAE